MEEESPFRLEPARLDEPTEEIADVIAEISAAAATLGQALHPRTATNLADLVRIVNTYYSNLIEGHNTRPRDIERALQGDMEQNDERRNLQLEAAAHVRVQREIDRLAAKGTLPEPASGDFLCMLHREFYRGAPEAMLVVSGKDRQIRIEPGEWRSRPEHDVAVGQHIPPSGERVAEFMRYFSERFRFERMGKASRLMAMAAAHHRFNYIHPFPDGNGRVGRLMSHAMASAAGIGAHGLWSVSRGLSRGLNTREDYMRMMDHADSPRQGDLDGRGNLSRRALQDFVLWFLKVCLDQVAFMSQLFELNTLGRRMRLYVERSERLQPEAANLLEAALIRGEFDRGDSAPITGLPERSARRVLGTLTELGILASDSPKGPVSLRFPADCQEDFFPRLYA